MKIGDKVVAYSIFDIKDCLSKCNYGIGIVIEIYENVILVAFQEKKYYFYEYQLQLYEKNVFGLKAAKRLFAANKTDFFK